MASNLTSMGVTSSASEGLTTLAGKITNISTDTGILYKNSNEYQYAASSSSGTNHVYNGVSLDLPSNFEVTFSMKSNNTSSSEIRFHLGSISGNSSNPTYTLFAQVTGNILCGWRDTNTHGLNYSQYGGDVLQITNDKKYHDFKFKVLGTEYYAYIDDVLNGHTTLSWLPNKNPYTLSINTWTSNTVWIKDIMVKAL